MRKLICSMVFIVSSLYAVAQIKTTEVYSVAEISFSGPQQSKSDAPAKDIDFWVLFKHESGSPSYKVHGFWDGDGNGGSTGNVFKVRFCPTKAGKWSLDDVYSNKSELNNQKEKEYVNATTSSNHGFWIQDLNSDGGRWFKRSDNSHQYIVGNTSYDFLAAPKGIEATGSALVKDVDENSQYFTKLRFAVATLGGNQGSLKPFFLGSVETFNESDAQNPKYFIERVDAVVKRGFEKDLICDLILGGADQKLTSEPYVKYMVARYGAYPNVWFCLNNEWNEKSSPSQEKAWGETLAKYQAYPNPVSSHATRGWISGLNGSWVTHAIRQGKLPFHLSKMHNCADAIVSDYNASGKKPAINDENGYDPGESSEIDVLEGILGSFAGGGYGTTGYKTASKQGGYFWGYNTVGKPISNHPSPDNLGATATFINVNMKFWNYAPKTPSSSIFTNCSGDFRVLEWSNNEYVLCSNGSASGVVANLPSGSWKVIQYNVVSKSSSTINGNASGAFSFSTPNSRSAITLFVKNGSSDNTPPSIPTLAAPSIGSQIDNRTPTFTWNSSSDASGIDYYELSMNGNVMNVGNTTQYKPTANLDYGTVLWKVKAIDKAGNASDWSSEFSFVVASTLPIITSPSKTTLFDPGELVKLEGVGSNLSWKVEDISDSKILKTGTGASIDFTVPLLRNTGDIIKVTLTGGGGKDEVLYKVEDLKPIVTTESIELDALVVNVDYSEDIEAEGGNPPLVWTSQNLPAGLTLGEGGNLTGKVSKSGTYKFKVKVTDADGDENEKELTIHVLEQAPLEIKINFQPSGSVPSGFIPDEGKPFGSRANDLEYGWSGDNTAGTRLRAGTVTAEKATLCHFNGNKWEIALPNGAYMLDIVFGDADFANQINNIVIEGTTFNDPDGEDNFDEFSSLEVMVKDGKLTLEEGAGSVNTKICYIIIKSKTIITADLQPLDSESKFSIFPNPSTSGEELSILDFGTIKEIKVFSVNGILISKSAVENKLILPLLSKGVYILEAVNSEDKTGRIKIMVH